MGEEVLIFRGFGTEVGTLHCGKRRRQMWEAACWRRHGVLACLLLRILASASPASGISALPACPLVTAVLHHPAYPYLAPRSTGGCGLAWALCWLPL